MIRVLTKRNVYRAVFTIALVATLGSLYFSEIEGLIPCTLCWYQRILMYPIVPFSIVALFLRDVHFPKYILPLSLLGACLALYHYLLQMLRPAAENSFFNCMNGSAACATIDVSYYGFITIPLMSFVAFALITILLLFSFRLDRYS